MYKHERTRVVRIVLTGGPCAGKSSSLQHFTEAAKREGFDVYTAPEAATLIFNCGLAFPQSEEKILEFQKALFKLQLQFRNLRFHAHNFRVSVSYVVLDVPHRTGVLCKIFVVLSDRFLRLLQTFINRRFLALHFL